MEFHAWTDEVQGSHIGHFEKEDFILTPEINMGASEHKGICNGDTIHNIWAKKNLNFSFPMGQAISMMVSYIISGSCYLNRSV